MPRARVAQGQWGLQPIGCCPFKLDHYMLAPFPFVLNPNPTSLRSMALRLVLGLGRWLLFECGIPKIGNIDHSFLWECIEQLLVLLRV